MVSTLTLLAAATMATAVARAHVPHAGRGRTGTLVADLRGRPARRLLLTLPLVPARRGRRGASAARWTVATTCGRPGRRRHRRRARLRLVRHRADAGDRHAAHEPGVRGLVIVAIAGNAVENVVGVQLAARNQADFAISVIVNSSLQVALALTPVLVFVSLFFATHLTLVFPTAARTRARDRGDPRRPRRQRRRVDLAGGSRADRLLRRDRRELLVGHVDGYFAIAATVAPVRRRDRPAQARSAARGVRR